MRLIDADRLKENIHANTPAAFQGMVPGINYIIDRQETIEPDADRWTPVYKGKPKAWERVLLCSDNNEITVGWWSDAYNQFDWWDDSVEMHGNVIAWMPLPKPYQEDKK